MSWLSGWVSHDEYINVCGYILNKTYNKSWHYWLSSNYDFIKLLFYIDSQTRENIKLVLRSLIVLTYGWNLKVVRYSLYIGSLLIKVSDNNYSL